uniref:Uncharacterized protein n=1 Tax=Oryzias latipes TaxID=8090 RepID=A0A3P9KBC4_ORYLA
MADDELEAIRRQRMAELQAKHGVSFMHEAPPPHEEMLKLGCC